MQTFQAAGTVPPPGPKNYVFVDEHNRHKRLKVMRACEGCRRRKIKCDAATTNTWPCAACKRLKLTCVPPVGGMEGDFGAAAAGDEQIELPLQDARLGSFSTDQTVYPQEFHNQQQDQFGNMHTLNLSNGDGVYHAQDFSYHHVAQENLGVSSHPAYQPRYESLDSTNGLGGPRSATSPQSAESVTAEDLAENLGDLKIDATGVALYTRQQNTSNAEPPAPIQDDDDEFMPAFSTSAGSQIRIPPALLPSEEEAERAFDAYFKYVHPYVPVLCRSYFLQQWQHNRHEVSPLLLEAIFACAGQVSDDPASGSQWLALGNRHEENFADMPRLSTIQALLLLLKARERTPKRGYFYRSWVTVKKIVSMAKDLELHEHYEDHQTGSDCQCTPAECLVKTRVWQLAMVCELMVGGPQGRYDFSVDIDSVDTSPNPPHSDMDDFESKISKQFSFWVRNVRNIRGYTETFHRLKRQGKDWARDPKFLAYNEDFRRWPEDLPSDLRISRSDGNSLPMIPSHFVANMHCHYQLGIVMLYKPQLSASKDFVYDENWKKTMTLCYGSAKFVCAIQEATIAQHDVLGLACMMRGLSFPIYAILSCIMVHLVAITSPDPYFNQDARNYFTRHMRVLEKCIAEWQMPEVEAQINGLRAAFSANLDRPFELRPSFPYGTPSETDRSPPLRRASEIPPNFASIGDHHGSQSQMQHGTYFHQSSIPPDSAIQEDNSNFYHDYQVDQNQHQFHSMPPTSHPHTAIGTTEQWNPTPIIDQFNTAFAIPQSALAPPSNSGYGSSPTLSLSQQGVNSQISSQQYGLSPNSQGYSSNPYTPPHSSQQISSTQQSYMQQQARLSVSHQSQTPSYYDANIHQAESAHIPISQPYGANPYGGHMDATPVSSQNFVTPKQWQQSVASVYDPGGLKRKWGYDQMALQQDRQMPSQYRRVG